MSKIEEADMKPPWSHFPEIPAGSIGWRMGPGEDYYDEFYRWFSSLHKDAQSGYIEENPEPPGWQRFYERILSSPWRS